MTRAEPTSSTTSTASSSTPSSGTSRSSRGPFAVLGERLGIAEPEVRDRVAKVKDAGVLRQLSAIFDTRALGYTSALVAAKVDPDHIDEAAAVDQRAPGRQPQLQAQPRRTTSGTRSRCRRATSLDEHIDVLHRESGALVTRKLPTLKLYKIGVKLDMTGKTAANAKTEVLEHERPERKAEMPAPDLSDLELATIRVVQHDLPNVERPFAAYGEQIGSASTEQTTCSTTLRSFKERKLMRRFAAVMNHRSAGFKANAMGVWAVPDDRLDEIGPQMAASPPCRTATAGRRTTTGRTACSRWCTAAARATARRRSTRSATETGIDEYCLLWSVKEYKKVRLRYFGPEWEEWEREGEHCSS